MEKFTKALEMINKLQTNLNTSYEYFLVRDALKKSTAPNIKGEKESKENVDIINKFIRFFGTSMEANRKIFALELAKFFDKDNKTLSLYKLINFIRINIKSFNKQNFLIYNDNRNFIDKLSKTYNSIDLKLLKEIEKDIINNSELIEKIKKYRNINLAHNQEKQEIISLFVGEIDDLFKSISKRLNQISYRINNEEMRGLGTDTYTEDCVYNILDYLKRFEPYRLKEIEEQYENDIK